MISIGIAVSTITGPPAYAAAKAASVRPTDTPGADDAIPITVSCATPIASGSSLGSDTGPFTVIGVNGNLFIPGYLSGSLLASGQRHRAGPRSAISGLDYRARDRATCGR